MLRAQFEGVLAEFSDAVKQYIALDDDSCTTFAIDDEVLVTLQYLDESDMIVLFAPVGAFCDAMAAGDGERALELLRLCEPCGALRPIERYNGMDPKGLFQAILAKCSMLVDFSLDHGNETFDSIVGAVEWAANHPDSVLRIASSFADASNTSGTRRNKVVSWSCIDGQIESISVKSTTKSKIGFKVDPVGVGVGVGFNASYSVTETTKDRTWYPDPPFKTLLSITSSFPVSDIGFDPTGSGAPLKNWLSKNAHGVDKIFAKLFKDEAFTSEIVSIYNNARLAADGDYALQEKQQDARRQICSMPQDATPNARGDAVHDFLVGIVTDYNSPQPADIAA